MKFNEALAGTQTQEAGWLYQNHYARNGYNTGQTAQLRFRSFDDTGNNSEYSTSSILTMAAASDPVTPTLTRITPGANSMTLDITADTGTDVIYGRYRRNQPAYTWVERSESFKVTGSGSIEITGLIDGIEYEFAAQNMEGGILGNASDFAGSRFGAPDSDAFATSRYAGKLNRRNGIAQQALNVAQQLGVKVTFTNDTEEDVTVYATILEQPKTTIGVRTGQIDRYDMMLSIPRQTNFPPTKFLVNARYTLNGISYQIDDVVFNNQEITMASIFTVTASVLGELDGY